MSPAEEQCRRHTHVMREVTLFVPAVKWGRISRPVSVNMIYAAEVERLWLLPGADCPPAAHFFTSCTRVPEGRLLTEQLLQMDFKLNFTFNTATAAQAPSVLQNHFSFLATFTPIEAVLIRMLVFCFFSSHFGEKCSFSYYKGVFCVFFHSSTVSFLPAQMMEFPQAMSPCVSHQHPSQQYAGMT